MESRSTVLRSARLSVSPAPWKVLFMGLFRPGTFMRIERSSPSGVAHFYFSFGFYCLLPVLLVETTAIVGASRSPETWRFHDFTPWTAIIAVMAQLVIGPLSLWVMATCFLASMNVVGLQASSSKERVIATGWYVGTTLLCLFYWWIGFGVFFASIRSLSGATDSAMTFALAIGAALALWVTWSAYRANLPGRPGGVRIVLGIAVGVLFYVLAMIPIGFVLRFLALEILQS